MSDELVVLHISDTHSGIYEGLLRDGTEVDEYLPLSTETHRVKLSQSSTEKWLWDEAYMPLIHETIRFAGESPVIVVHTGDAIHGQAHIASDYAHSAILDQQVVIAEAALSELRTIPTLAAWIMIYGTAAHDYGQQQGTRLLSEKIAAWGNPVYCRAYVSDRLGGVKSDIAHHGPNVSYTEDKVAMARKFALRLCRGDMERGEEMPGLILRGHIHQKVLQPVVIPWGGSEKTTLLSVAPPLCGPNEYALRYLSSRGMPYVEAGGNIIRISDGRVVEWESVTAQRDIRQRVFANVAYHNKNTTNSNNENGVQQDGEISESPNLMDWLRKRVKK